MRIVQGAKRIRYKGQTIFLRVDELNRVQSYLLNDGFAKSQGYKSKLEMLKVTTTHGNLWKLNRNNIWLTPKNKGNNSLISKFQEIYDKTKKE